VVEALVLWKVIREKKNSFMIIFLGPETAVAKAVDITVALNSPQYGNSVGCGMCVSLEGTGPGSGKVQLKVRFTQFVPQILT